MNVTMGATKIFLVFLATVAVSAAIDGFEPGLRIRFGRGPDPGAGESFFFKAPRSVDNATAAGWESTERPHGHFPQLVMYCYADKVVCCLYDDTGYIAGVQVAIPKSEFSENVFDWEKRGFTSWNTTVNGECKSFWTLQQYFVNEEYLAKSKEDRIATRDPSSTLQVGAVWTTGINKELMRISNLEKDIISEHLFLEQACIPWMGQHYYYNLSTTTECTSDQMYPWFLMYHKGELSATAFITYGKLEVSSSGRDWFEHPNLAAVKAIAPKGPECMYEISDNPGVLTMHFFFVDEPWTIPCPS